MSHYFQLQIPTTCHENWDTMRPEEKGRFCAACSKTVIDFTYLTDQELIAHLAKAGQNTCGRLATDQLNRGLSVSIKKKKKGWPGWPMIIAGMLSAIRLPAQPSKQSVVSEKIILFPKHDTVHTPVTDSFKILPAATAFGHPLTGSVGGIVIGTRVTKSYSKIVKDTLTVLRLLPKKELVIYPNPVQRGAAVSLSWTTTPGIYDVSLLSTAGNLIQQSVMEVKSAGQVDLMEMPASLSAGIYFLHAARPGQTKPLNFKIIVR
jgi:hypothetical protein